MPINCEKTNVVSVKKTYSIMDFVNTQPIFTAGFYISHSLFAFWPSLYTASMHLKVILIVKELNEISIIQYTIINVSLISYQC